MGTDIAAGCDVDPKMSQEKVSGKLTSYVYSPTPIKQPPIKRSPVLNVLNVLT